MNDTEKFLLRLFDVAGEDKIAVSGRCQHCGGEVSLLVDYVDKVIICEGNGGMKYYSHAGKPQFLCSECEERGKMLGSPCEVYSRVVGYLSPVHRWNLGKRLEFEMRRPFETDLQPDIPTA